MTKEEMKAREEESKQRACEIEELGQRFYAAMDAADAQQKAQRRETISGYAPGIILIVLGLLKFLWDWVTS